MMFLSLKCLEPPGRPLELAWTGHSPLRLPVEPALPHSHLRCIVSTGVSWHEPGFSLYHFINLQLPFGAAPFPSTSHQNPRRFTVSTDISRIHLSSSAFPRTLRHMIPTFRASISAFLPVNGHFTPSFHFSRMHFGFSRHHSGISAHDLGISRAQPEKRQSNVRRTKCGDNSHINFWKTFSRRAFPRQHLPKY